MLNGVRAVSKLIVKVVDRDMGWNALVKRAKEAKDGRVKVGVLADDAKGGADHDGLTVAELAVVHHFGTSTIPARPFLAMAFDKNRQELIEMGAGLINAVITGKMTGTRALGLMGLKLSTEAKKVISTGSQLKPLAQSTITARLRAKRTAMIWKQYVSHQKREVRRLAREQRAHARLGVRLSALSEKTGSLGDVFKNIGRAEKMRASASLAATKRAARDRRSDLGATFKAIGMMASGVRPLVDTGRLLNSITWALDREGK